MEGVKKTGNFDKLLEKSKEHQAALKELKESMGEYEYNKFIETGRKMFAPA
jgi:hypothetical protein